MSIAHTNAALADDRRRADLEKRLWKKVVRSSEEECWPWVARARHRFGYGVISSGQGTGKALYAHVVSWGLANGLIPNGASILHRCDNPGCCNPRHLYVGTHQQNMADMKARGRRLGIGHSEETRLKIKIGRAKNPPKQTEEGRRSRSEALKRRWADPEWRARFSSRMSGERNPRFGKRPPEHQLEAVRKGHRKFKGYKHTEETKQRMREAYARRMAKGDV